MMRIVEQVGGGGAHGNGTVWAICPNEPKAWPIATQYTIDVMWAHGILMTWDQMRERGYTWQTDGNSITSTYQVQPVIEALPDSLGGPGPASQV